MKRGKYQSILCVILCIVFLVTTAGGVLVSNAADDNAGISCNWETVNNCRTNKVAPEGGGADEKFAGFYKDSACETPLKASETQDTYTGTIYAKFVPKEVLSVKCQLTAGTTVNSKETDLRILTSVDSLNYQNAGFYVEIGSAKGTFTAQNVYETIYGYKKNDTTLYKANESFAPESTHFMAFKFTDIPKSAYDTQIKVTPQWTTLDGIVVTGVERSFTIKDIIYMYQTGEYDPDHNYTEYIQGEAYEFFFIPYSSENSVEWDEAKQAFHLKNVQTGAGDGRSFSLNKEYIANVIKYTDATVLKFELSNDGVLVENGQQYDYLYQAYDRAWGAYNWTGYHPEIKTYEVEINLADMVNDDGTLKAYTIMHARQGMYVSNVRLCRADGSDPNHNYAEAIRGEAYEFFFIPYSTENSVEWDETKQAFHLKNIQTGAGDGRSFSLDKEYIDYIKKYTDATVLKFQLSNDGALVENGQQYDYLYQAYDRAWGAFDWTGYHPEIRTYEVEINLADIPEGSAYTIMHARQGMYVSDITLCREDGTDLSHDYAEAIKGEAYEFFFIPYSSENSVEWDETKQAFHLKNVQTGAGDGRSFSLDKEYIANIMKYTDAKVLKFKLSNDGALVENGQQYDYLYQAYDRAWGAFDWTGYHPEIRTYEVEINLADMVNPDGTLKAYTIMHARQGMYVSDITLCREDGSDPSHDYAEAIQGEEYEFFIYPNDSSTNSVEWDEEKQAFHLINKSATQGNDRAFLFDAEYLAYVIEYTDAEVLTFELQNDGEHCGSTFEYDYMYKAYDMQWGALDWWTGYYPAIMDWATVEINLADIPTNEDGTLKPFSLMHATQGMYVRNITLK